MREFPWKAGQSWVFRSAETREAQTQWTGRWKWTPPSCPLTSTYTHLWGILSECVHMHTPETMSSNSIWKNWYQPMESVGMLSVMTVKAVLILCPHLVCDSFYVVGNRSLRGGDIFKDFIEAELKVTFTLLHRLSQSVHLSNSKKWNRPTDLKTGSLPQSVCSSSPWLCGLRFADFRKPSSCPILSNNT